VANPQKENGFSPISNELLEAISLSDINGHESRIFWHIIRFTYGYGRKTFPINYPKSSKLVGIDRHNIYRTIKSLSNMNMVIKDGDEIGINKNYEEWTCYPGKVVIKNDTQMVSNLITNGIKNDTILPNTHIILKKKEKRKREGTEKTLENDQNSCAEVESEDHDTKKDFYISGSIKEIGMRIVEDMEKKG
jgi:phage replication O-like protein O